MINQLPLETILKDALHHQILLILGMEIRWQVAVLNKLHEPSGLLRRKMLALIYIAVWINELLN